MKHEPLNLAVVGLATLYPQAVNIREFWHNIFVAKDLLRDVPAAHWLIEDYYNPDPSAPDQTYCKRGAFLDPIPFDPFEYKIPPSSLASTDTSQLLTLIAAKQLLQDLAPSDITQLDLKQTSIILGTTGAQELILNSGRLDKPIWLEALRRHKVFEPQAQKICTTIASLYVPWTESTFPGALGNVITGRVANYFNLGGTNCVVDAACASSLSALAMGVNELVLGQSNLVITGGVDTMQHIAMYMCFSKTPALSRTGDCRPFADDADGTMLGEGVGLLALKRLAEAERDGDPIYAVIRGVGASSDGSGKSVHVPVAEGQAYAIRRAYEQAGYSPASVELLEAHGTATGAGDIAEFAGLQQVFGASRGHKVGQWCALGSIKSQIGHTKGAAGAAGLIKAVLALHNKVLPPTLKIKQPNAKLQIATSPFYLNTRVRPWLHAGPVPRRAGVSSFGFGGANFHVTVEEYCGPGKRPALIRTNPTELLLLSGANKNDLIQQCQALCSQALTTDLTNLAYQTQQQPHLHHAMRLAIVANHQDYVTQLKSACTSLQQDTNPLSAHVFFAKAPCPGKLAFLFPGQGSQYLNMGADIAMAFPLARALWDAATTQSLCADLTLAQVVFPVPSFNANDLAQQTTQLAQTQWTQPALAATSWVLFKLLSALGLKPECVAGHSFGEITALAAAGWCDFSTLLKIARKRGELMANSANTTNGAMLAIIHPVSDIIPLLASFPADQLSIANYNSPQQCVVSGITKAIAQLESLLHSKKYAYHRLPVATAFHSSMMAAACQPFANWLQQQTISNPSITVYSNLDAKAFPNDVNTICHNLAQQLVQPVQFSQQIEAMYQQGVRTFVEVGAGSVLKKLVNQCLPNQPHQAIAMDEKDHHGVTQLWRAIAQLFVNGSNLDFNPLWQGYLPLPLAPAVAKPSKTTVMIQGCNYGKPYPPAQGAAGKTKPHTEQQQTSIQEQTMTTTPAKAETSLPTPSQSPTPTSSVNTYNYDAVLNFEHQIVQAHTAYQRAMAESHIAFLQTAERILTVLSGQPVVPMIPTTAATFSNQNNLSNPTPMQYPASPMPVASPAVFAPAPVITPTTTPSVSSLTMPSAPSMPAAPTIVPMPMPSLSSQTQATATTLSPNSGGYVPPAPAAAIAPTSAIPAQTPGIEQLMLSIVAEKTGYPVDMLNLQMDLEADLGIDSIKRVEILSAAQQQIPNLPEIDATEMIELKTLGDIADYFKTKI